MAIDNFGFVGYTCNGCTKWFINLQIF